MMIRFDLAQGRKRFFDACTVLVVALLVFTVGCASNSVSPNSVPKSRNAADLLIVDCLLPGQVRRLGRSITYLTPRRPVKVPTSECEIRGGEYVAYDRANFATSLKIWLPNAKNGDPEAQTYVGEIFEKGLGLQADPRVAASWYQKAADQGYSRAMVNLGYLYESGIGVPKDIVKAMNYYRAAAGFDDGNLEYVTPLEVASRKQQAQDIVDLTGQVAELEAKNAQLQQRRAQLESQQQQARVLQAEVERQRTLVLEQAKANEQRNENQSEDNTRLAESLTELEQVNNQLLESENGKATLIEQLRKQQSETEQLRTAFGAANKELNEARQNLLDQENKVSAIQARAEAESDVASTDNSSLAEQNRIQAEQIRSLETRLESAQDAFDLEASKTDDLQRSLAQRTSLLQDQIASAESREQSLQSELSQLSSTVAQSEISESQLKNQLTNQLKSQQTQVEQIRRQLNNSARELLLTQSRLETAQAAIANANSEQTADQAELRRKREETEQKIFELENGISRARTRELEYQSELDRLSGNLVDSNLDNSNLKSSLNSRITAQQSEISTLRVELDASREAAQAALANANSGQSASQSALQAQQEQSAQEIQELENRISSARSRELEFQNELDRLSGNLVDSNLDNANLKSSLNSKITAQQDQIGSLRGELDTSNQDLEKTRQELEAAQSVIGQKSPELDAVRQKLAAQKALFEKQIALALKQEESLKLELSRLGSTLVDEQLDKAVLKQQIDQQLASQRQQTQNLLAELESSNRELGNAQAQLQQSEGKYANQTSELSVLRKQLEQQQSAIKLQITSTEQREKQLEAELERVSQRAANAEVQNALLGKEIAEQKQLIASLQTQYRASSQQLAASDNSLGSQQNQIAQLQGELLRIRETSIQALQDERQVSAKYRQELEEAQTIYASLNAEVVKLRGQQSNQSRNLEQRLETASNSENQLKKQLDDAVRSAENLQEQLSSQEQRYQAELAAVKDAFEEVQDGSIDAQLKLASLENQLTDQETLLTSREQEINELQSAVTKAQAAAEKPQIEQIQYLVDAGPAIEIIEPQITVTRGADSLQIATRGTGTSVDVIGRVKPVAELLSFKIDNETVPLNQNGVFKYAAKASASTINLLAINEEGERTDLELSLIQKRSATANTPPGADLSGIKFGSYHALIIGNNNFEHLQNLKTAENDAIAVETLLREKYGFKTKLLLNANRYDTLSALNEMRATLTSEDNLIIYYAGHGELSNDTGYWMPVDAEPDNDANWISNKQITGYIETMNAKHIMVIADSCYSGTLSRASLSQLSTGLTAQQQRKWYELNTGSTVRTVLTSGAVKPVIDSVGSSKHSVFSAAFLDELEGVDKPVMSAYKLFLKVQERVKADALRIGVDQNPQYSAMQYAGHESGEFLFVQSSGTLSGSLELNYPSSGQDLKVAQK